MEEAKFAVEHPKLHTEKEIAKVLHKGGAEVAKRGAIIGGIFSAVTNVVTVLKEDNVLQGSS